MITLEIDNSFSKISGLTPQQERGLRETLSYTVGGSSAYFSGYGIRRKSLLSKRGEFPTGLGHRVMSSLLTQKLDVDIRDKRVKPRMDTQKSTLLHKPYPAQLEALKSAIKAERGIISMPTGTGKSQVIKMIAQHYGIATLVIVPSLEIKRQLSETLKDCPYVTVENIDSAILAFSPSYDVLIIDEAHHAAAKTYQRLNKNIWTDIYYRFFLTATPFRNDTEETLLFESIAGQVTYELSYKKAVENKMIVPVESYFVQVPKQTTNAVTWAQVYSQLVVNNDIRNDIIANLLKRLYENNVYTLCLVKEVAHGEILSRLTNMPFVSGSDDNSREYISHFNAGTIPVLIGTTGILGEGIDTKPAEYIVVAGLGKAKSQFQQQIGRGVRTYPDKESAKVIILRDPSHKFTLRHFNAQKKILIDEYGVTPIKLDV